jgi:hypothetical protein
LLGQEKKTTLPTAESETFTWKGGNDEFVDVKFAYYLEEKMEKEILDKVVMNIMVQSKYVLKNKYSFVPKKLTLMKTDTGYSGISEFVGKNSYGVEGLTKTYFSFVNEGDGQVKKLFSN